MIPLHILTGFLGAGKTTILSELLREPRGERIAVMVNEVGELALDDLLLERIDEDVLALASGCACCTVRGELYEATARVLALRPTRIVLETTGLADPAPILHGLATDPSLAEEIQVAGVIAAADAARITSLLESHPEARRQLEFADRIVLTKSDLAPQRVESALESLRAAAPGCEVRAADQGRVAVDWLFASAALGSVRDASDATAWLHHGPHGVAHQTFSVTSPSPASLTAAQLWLQLVTQLDGPRLLRIKGLIECSESGDVFALQSAEHAVSPPRRLAQRPRGFRGARIVLIERGMPAHAIEPLLASLRAALDGRQLLVCEPSHPASGPTRT